MAARPVERHQVSFEFRWLSGEVICQKSLPEHRECRLLRRIAIDSGAVNHVAGPKDVPDSVPFEKPSDGRSRNFVGAKGDIIDND